MIALRRYLPFLFNTLSPWKRVTLLPSTTAKRAYYNRYYTTFSVANRLSAVPEQTSMSKYISK